MKFKTLAAVTIRPLIARSLLLVRRLRRKQLVAGEVSALRNLGSAGKAADLLCQQMPAPGKGELLA
jgi:hypothetical protein